MIPMSCPSCGRRGNIPPDRLNTRMHCKKCDAVFYMDSSGKIVLGDPAQPGKKGQAAKAKAKAKANPKKKRESDPADLGAAWRSIPLPARIGGGVVVLGLALWMSGLKLPRFTSEPLPEQLEERAGVVAKAFMSHDRRLLRRITAPDTVADADAWLEKTRAMVDAPTDLDVPVTVYPPKEDNSAGKAETLVKLSTLPKDTEEPAPVRLKNKEEAQKKRAEAQKKAKAKASKGQEPPPLQGFDVDGTFDILLHWKRVDDKWMFDGTETLKDPPPPGGVVGAEGSS